MQIEKSLKSNPKTKLKDQKQALDFFILEDDPIFARIFAKNLHKTFSNARISTFENAIEAIGALPDGCIPPSVIILDVLLTGPDGFTFLNEIASYPDLSNIPVIIVSSLNFPMSSLDSYNVKKILNKTTMQPEDLSSAVIEVLGIH